ncbi:MAG: hypothetical protein CSA96_02245 [Bacteroidetes bacterium]|nr:MAG: hypothetical protein CSA96_02245 [Bacteroidota bacterium]
MDKLQLSAALLFGGLAFPLYYFLSKGGRIAAIFQKAETGKQGSPAHLIVQRLLGLLFLGILPAIFILLTKGSLQSYGLRAPGSCFWWLLPLAASIVVLGYFAAGSASNKAMYPQIRKQIWNPGLLLVSALSWLFFLLGYEFLFRGYLLFASYNVLGTWPAIALNCSLYALAHMYKGPRETFGAIPLGILLCWISLESGSILYAFLLHGVMALSNEWWSISRNPEMKVRWKNRT